MGHPAEIGTGPQEGFQFERVKRNRGGMHRPARRQVESGGARLGAPGAPRRWDERAVSEAVLLSRVYHRAVRQW
jgi:hypothetical protein